MGVRYASPIELRVDGTWARTRRCMCLVTGGGQRRAQVSCDGRGGVISCDWRAGRAGNSLAERRGRAGSSSAERRAYGEAAPAIAPPNGVATPVIERRK